MTRRPFKRQQKKKRHGTNFWDHEYKNGSHLKLSDNPSEDYLKFTRFLARHHAELLVPDSTMVDLGCGNGRQLAHAQDTFGMSVVGFDISPEAIRQARKLCPLPEKADLVVHSIANPLPIPDTSCQIVLDMMTSHFLNKKEREKLKQETIRVLEPGGFLFMKTFLRDEDLHTKRLLEEYPGPEEGTYIHPKIGVPEFVYSEEELSNFLSSDFSIKRVYRSHKHRFKGKARKRRTISVYAQKNYT